MITRLNLIPRIDTTVIGVADGIHDHPCAHCPSAHFPPDPESLDYLKASHRFRVEGAFPCAWRPDKYCRGYCDKMGVTAEDLAKARTPEQARAAAKVRWDRVRAAKINE